MITYWTPRGQLAHGDATSTLWYFVFYLNCLWCKVTVNFLPVFEPNDFFWEKHWDGKEPKWIAYARAVRLIMADFG